MFGESCLPICTDSFRQEINSILGRLFSQYFNVTFLSFIDPEGFVVEYQIHSSSANQKKKLMEISKKALEFKLATTKAARLLGFDSTPETFIKAESHIIVTYEIELYVLIIIIEMSNPLIDEFDFDKFNQKIELILIELKKKIDQSKNKKEDD